MKVEITFKIIKTPIDEYTASSFPEGSTITMNLEDYNKHPNVVNLNFGQGDGAFFKKDELEPAIAYVTTIDIIDNVKLIKQKFFK